MPVLPDELSRVVGANRRHAGRDRVERLFPADLHPPRVLVQPLARIGPSQGLLQPVRVEGVVAPGDSLGADADVVVRRACRIGIDGAYRVTLDLDLDAAEVDALRARRLHVTGARGGAGGGAREVRGGRDPGEIGPERRASDQGGRSRKELPAGQRHGDDLVPLRPPPSSGSRTLRDHDPDQRINGSRPCDQPSERQPTTESDFIGLLIRGPTIGVLAAICDFFGDMCPACRRTLAWRRYSGQTVASPRPDDLDAATAPGLRRRPQQVNAAGLKKRAG